MKYKGYEIEKIKGGLCVNGVMDFDPVHTFESGQCFRWHREEDGSYTGVVRGKVANVSCSGGRMIIKNADIDEFIRIWFDYFDLGRNYAEVKKAVATDDIMKKAVEFGSGIRLLKQEPWEVLISFIISSNNRIPRIMKIIETLSRLCGREIEYNGRKYYGFPDVRCLGACTQEQLEPIKAGYRCGYIQRAAASVLSGEFDLSRLYELDTPEARKYLTNLYGVGDKVADCILLYGGIKYDVFPTDVWVKRVMEELYFGREASFKEIREFALEKFGKYAGIAQQYLFYYARVNRIGV